MLYNSTVVVDNEIESSYTWTNLIQGIYHFSVVASTSAGPGEAASMMLSISKLFDSYVFIIITHGNKKVSM